MDPPWRGQGSTTVDDGWRPCRIVPGPRKTVQWGNRKLLAREADEGFYRICGVKGSGKTHLTKYFILEALREVETNPHAKLIVYEPKRELYAWMKSLGLSSPVRYFMPSDKRSVALDFTRDYPNDLDSMTLALAFHPNQANETQKFWGDSLRTIYAGVFTAIKQKLGRFDLRLACLVIENEDYTEQLLGTDPYLVQARKLVKDHGDAVGETKQNIQMTIHSRIGDMKVIAAHLDQARKQGELFSLRDFLEEPNAGVLAVSKDGTYGMVQDPMNGVLFARLVQLIEATQKDERRKIFIVIDEFPTLAGDLPCPGIYSMFLRLRDRGVTILIAYQAYSTLKRVYGEHASEIVGQCTNVMYLRQADNESAEYAADDLGWERGYEVAPPSMQSGSGGSSFSLNHNWYDRPIFSASELQNLKPAREWSGLSGVVKTAERTDPDELRNGPAKDYPEEDYLPSEFSHPPSFVDEQIPKRDARDEELWPEYDKLDPEIEDDAPKYFEQIKLTQRIEGLSDQEKRDLGLVDRPEKVEGNSAGKGEDEAPPYPRTS